MFLNVGGNPLNLSFPSSQSKNFQLSCITVLSISFFGRRWGDGFFGNLPSHLLYFHPSLMFPQLLVHPVHSFMVNNWTSLWSGREVEREEERPRSRNKPYLVSVKCCCPAVVLFLNGHICSDIWLRLEESFCFTVSTSLTINKQFLLIFLTSTNSFKDHVIFVIIITTKI